MFFDRWGLRAAMLAVALVWSVVRGDAAELKAKSQIVEDLYDAYFVDPDHGWVVGVFGAIYTTSDGGKHWSPQPTPTIQHLYSVEFANEREGWAVGRGGEILHTADGGKTWERQKSGTTKPLFQIVSTEPQQAWVVGDWGCLLHTTDGGKTWHDRSIRAEPVVGEPGAPAVGEPGAEAGAPAPGAEAGVPASPGEEIIDQILYSIDFADPRNGWIVGEFGSIRHTSDGGATWTLQHAGTDKTFFGVTAVSPEKAWAVGIDGLVVRTQDAGQTWQIQQGQAEMATFEKIGFLELLRNPGLYDIKIEGNTGYIVGDTGNVLVTEDGGETWKGQLLPAEWRLSWIRGLSVLPNGRGLIVGAQGMTFIVEGDRMYFSQTQS